MWLYSECWRSKLLHVTNLPWLLNPIMRLMSWFASSQSGSSSSPPSPEVQIEPVHPSRTRLKKGKGKIRRRRKPTYTPLVKKTRKRSSLWRLAVSPLIGFHRGAPEPKHAHPQMDLRILLHHLQFVHYYPPHNPESRQVDHHGLLQS